LRNTLRIIKIYRTEYSGPKKVIIIIFIDITHISFNTYIIVIIIAWIDYSFSLQELMQKCIVFELMFWIEELEAKNV